MTKYVGTSGYARDDWRGRFYPIDLPQEKWLEFYSQQFAAVEVNLTFFRLPASPVFRHWRMRTPEKFRFFLKGSQSITHRQRLDNCHEELAQFFERASELEEKWAGILWQLPPKFPHDVELLEDFLAESERVQLVYGKVRQVFEFRDISWFEEPVYDVLERYNAAIALADWPFNIRIRKHESGIVVSTGYTSEVEETRRIAGRDLLGGGKGIRPRVVVPITSDFLYFRRHGPAAEYASAYKEADMKQLADDVRSFANNRDIYVFFANDAQAYAVENAMQLMKLLKA